MQIKRCNWKSSPTGWQNLQAWKAHRANMVAQFRSEADAAGNAIAGAQNNLSSGLATISVQTMIQRIQTEIRASAQKQLDLLL